MCLLEMFCHCVLSMKPTTTTIAVQAKQETSSKTRLTLPLLFTHETPASIRALPSGVADHNIFTFFLKFQKIENQENVILSLPD